MKKLLTAVLAICISTLTYAEDLSIVTYNLKPFHFNANGKTFGRASQVDGALTDFLDTWFNKANVTYQMELRSPKDRAVASADRSKNGGLFLTTADEDLADRYDFIGPVTNLAWGIYQTGKVNKKDLTAIDEMQLLVEARSEINNGLKVQNIRGRTYSSQRDIVNEMLRDSANVWALEAVEAERVNKAFTELKLLPAFVYQYEPLYLAVNKSLPMAKKQALQDSLDELIKAGEVDKLLSAYINN